MVVCNRQYVCMQQLLKNVPFLLYLQCKIAEVFVILDEQQEECRYLFLLFFVIKALIKLFGGHKIRIISI